MDGRLPFRAKAPVNRGKSGIIHSHNIPRVLSENRNTKTPLDTSIPNVQTPVVTSIPNVQTNTEPSHTPTPASAAHIPTCHLQIAASTATKSSHGSVSTSHIQQNTSPHRSSSYPHHISSFTPVPQQYGFIFVPTSGLFVTYQIVVGNQEPSPEVADKEIPSNDEVEDDLDDEVEHDLDDEVEHNIEGHV